MSISGNLKTMELSELLQWIAQGAKTGSLLIDNGRVRKKIFFKDGKIVATASTHPSEFLGHFLVAHGYITEEQLAKAMEIQATSKLLLGKILVTLGAIGEGELQDVLVMKTEESVYDLFDWDEGEFRFVEADNLEGGQIPVALDVTGIVLQGINRVDEWKRIREVIPDPDSVLPVTVRAPDAGSLPSQDAMILEHVNDDRTIREICMHSHASEYHVSQVLFREFQEQRLKLIRLRPHQLPQGRIDEETPQPANSEASSEVTGEVNAEVLIESGHRQLEAGNYRRALRHMRAALSLEPDSKETEQQLADAKRRISEKLAAEGLDLTAVPVLECSVEELTQLNLAPEEGFVLSRVDGTYDLQSLIKISPMDAVDAQLVFHRLLQAGHISLR